MIGKKRDSYMIDAHTRVPGRGEETISYSDWASER